MLKSLFIKTRLEHLQAKSDRYSKRVKHYLKIEEDCIRRNDYKEYWYWSAKTRRLLNKRLKLCKQILKLRGY